jgi:uncharacterized membrane protein YeaQ/YmgE (transglycosylase-associated protein family)
MTRLGIDGGLSGTAQNTEDHMLAPESILAWIVIGAIAGWHAGLLVKGYGFGLIGNIIIGILGAGIAGILAQSMGIRNRPPAISWRP